MKTTYKEAIRRTEATIRSIDFDQLPISDYNKRYIRTLKENLLYFMEIEARILEKLFAIVGNGTEAQSTIVDYGGGIGFMSLLAKQLGVQKVIYVDINPNSVQTVRLLQAIAGYGPDVVLEGDSRLLKQWCTDNGVVPDGLISADVIEHIYRLDSFFDDLQAISSRMAMVFSTGSNPENRRVVKRLHRMMDSYETGTAVTPNYYAQRLAYIVRTFPGLTEAQQKQWAGTTRGMIYEDIKKAICASRLPLPTDAHNTCDPATGNFVERILSFETYRSIARKQEKICLPEAGFYNIHRRNRLFSLICRLLNRMIRLSKKHSFSLSPFIFLTFRSEKEATEHV